MLRLFVTLRIVISVLFFSFSFNWLDADLLIFAPVGCHHLPQKYFFGRQAHVSMLITVGVYGASLNCDALAQLYV